MQNPCKKDCPERYPGCRSICLMRRAYDEQQEEIRKARHRESILNEYVCREIRKSGRHIRRTIWRGK